MRYCEESIIIEKCRSDLIQALGQLSSASCEEMDEAVDNASFLVNKNMDSILAAVEDRKKSYSMNDGLSAPRKESWHKNFNINPNVKNKGTGAEGSKTTENDLLRLISGLLPPYIDLLHTEVSSDDEDKDEDEEGGFSLGDLPDEDEDKNEKFKINFKTTDKNSKELKINFKTTEKNSKDFTLTREHTWDCKEQIDLDKFLKKTKHPFEYGGCIKSKTDEDEDEDKDKKKIGYFIEEVKKFKDKKQFVYLLTISNNNVEKIIKCGKVKGPLRSRTYMAGTEYNWTITGQASPTNYIYSQIFRACLPENISFKFYVYHPPISNTTFKTSTGGLGNDLTSSYEAVEKDLNNHLKKILGRNLIGERNLEELNKF